LPAHRRRGRNRPARTDPEDGASGSRSGTARPRVLGSFGDFGHPHLLRLVLRTQPRSGGGSKMRPSPASGKEFLVSTIRPHAKSFDSRLPENALPAMLRTKFYVMRTHLCRLSI